MMLRSHSNSRKNSTSSNKGKEKQRFQFDLTIHTLQLPENYKSELGITWTRGSRSASTTFVKASDGLVDWEERLTLVETLYKTTGTMQYASKRSRILVKQKVVQRGDESKKTIQEKQVGVCHLDLSKYVGMDIVHPDIELEVRKCSIPQLSLRISIASKWLKELDTDFDIQSVASDATAVFDGLSVFDSTGDLAPSNHIVLSPNPSTRGSKRFYKSGSQSASNSMSSNESMSDKRRSGSLQLSTASNGSSIDDLEDLKSKKLGEVFNIRYQTLQNECEILKKQNESLRRQAIRGVYTPESGVAASNLHQIPEHGRFAGKESPQDSHNSVNSHSSHSHSHSNTNGLTPPEGSYGNDRSSPCSSDYSDGKIQDSYYEERLALIAEVEKYRAETEAIRKQRKEEKASYKKRIEFLEKQIENYRSKNSQLENEKDNLDQQKDQKITELMESEDELIAKVNAAESRNNELQVENKHLKFQSNETRELLTAARKEIGRLEVELERVGRNYSEVQKSLENSEDELKKQVAFFSLHNDDLEATLMMVRKSWQDTSQLMEKQVNALQKELVDTKLKMEETHTKYRDLDAKMQKFKENYHQMSMRKKELSEALTKNEVSMATKTVEIARLRSQIDLLKEEKNQLQLQLMKNTQLEKEKLDSKKTTAQLDDEINEYIASNFNLDSPTPEAQ